MIKDDGTVIHFTNPKGWYTNEFFLWKHYLLNQIPLKNQGKKNELKSNGPVNYSFNLPPLEYYLTTWQPAW